MGTPEMLSILQCVRPPMAIIVFGAGNDSAFWNQINRGGRTVFLEDDEWWKDHVARENPSLEVYLVKYTTKLSDWKNLINNPKKLTIDLPKEIRGMKWDIAIVDGPAGYAPETPGRMQSIYAASQVVKEGGIVFIHDSEREVEMRYGEKFLGKENIVGEVWGRALMRRYIKTASLPIPEIQKPPIRTRG